ncbi:MAG: right-handed parallel beta-helix repeat-containing protein [bacterium]|nr:right-handed parallel beta-helix repeat-containing protein [bacterium]
MNKIMKCILGAILLLAGASVSFVLRVFSWRGCISTASRRSRIHPVQERIMKTVLFILVLLLIAAPIFGQNLSGSLSGTLGPGTYTIVGDIRVDTTRSLTILPPTTLNSQGQHSFTVYGTLSAVGTESNSIVFTTTQLQFRGSISSGSQLSYCLVQGSSATYAGGVYCYYYSSPTFTNCTLSGNTATQSGGGVLCYSSSPTFTNCTLSGNSATSGGGVLCQSSSSPGFTNCTISGNTATYGGGVYCISSSSPSFTSCTITGNSATSGGGVFCWSSSSPSFNSTIIAFSTGSGIYFASGASSTAWHCDVFGNSGGDFAGVVPAGLGQITTVNANCDPSDQYYNIFLDPRR